VVVEELLPDIRVQLLKHGEDLRIGAHDGAVTSERADGFFCIMTVI
jgi:hypothetical protein